MLLPIDNFTPRCQHSVRMLLLVPTSQTGLGSLRFPSVREPGIICATFVKPCPWVWPEFPLLVFRKAQGPPPFLGAAWLNPSKAWRGQVHNTGPIETAQLDVHLSSLDSWKLLHVLRWCGRMGSFTCKVWVPADRQVCRRDCLKGRVA